MKRITIPILLILLNLVAWLTPTKWLKPNPDDYSYVPPPLPLPVLVKDAIDKSNPNISPVRREMLSLLLPFIADQVFTDQKHKEYWIVLIGVESAYDGTAKSHAGAVGLGQLIPRFREDFAKTCDMNGATETDIRDDFTNAYLSACFFRHLITSHNDNIPLALISYNAGPNSKDIKRAKSGAAVSHEPAAYTTNILVRTQELK